MKRHSRPGLRQRGVTLVELMIGLTLGMIVSAALLLVFANASSNGQNLQRSSSHIENARYAVELLREDLRQAGFFGEVAVAGATFTTPNPCQTVPTGFSAAPFGLPTPLRGYRASEVLGCLTSANRLAGTDALAVRRLDTVSVNPATLAAANQQYHVQYSFCSTDPATTPLVFDKLAAAFVLHDRGCTNVNTVRPYVARLYFVASCNRCGSGGDNTPTLKRLDLVGNQLVETALVEGVETLRFEYGFDTNGDGNADVYLATAGASGALSQWENVVSLKVHLIVRSTERASGSGLTTAQTFQLGDLGSVTTSNDGYARRAYSATVRLINPSGAREAQ